MFNKIYKYDNVYLNKLYKVNYIYEVQFIVLNDLRGMESILNTSGFKSFIIREYDKEKNKVYDTNKNIRDLYSIDIHTTNKQKEEVERFNILNDYLLLLNSRIYRRVTKKQIVYKKDKTRSIIAIQISKSNCLKLFFLKEIEEFDKQNKFLTIPESNKKPLEKLIKVKNDEDLNYVKNILKKYIERIFI